MDDIDIKRGYEILPDNNVRFGIKITNNTDSAISDVEVILDYTTSLFDLEGDKIQNMGNIPVKQMDEGAGDTFMLTRLDMISREISLGRPGQIQQDIKVPKSIYD